MKQTIVILTALCLSLLLLSGFLAVSYAQQDALLGQKDALLSAAAQKNEELTLQLQKAVNIRNELEASLTAERQAASRHSAALETASAQGLALEEECGVLRTALDRANRECADLRAQVEALQPHLPQTQEAGEPLSALRERNQQPDSAMPF